MNSSNSIQAYSKKVWSSRQRSKMSANRQIELVLQCHHGAPTCLEGVCHHFKKKKLSAELVLRLGGIPSLKSRFRRSLMIRNHRAASRRTRRIRSIIWRRKCKKSRNAPRRRKRSWSRPRRRCQKTWILRNAWSWKTYWTKARRWERMPSANWCPMKCPRSSRMRSSWWRRCSATKT